MKLHESIVVQKRINLDENNEFSWCYFYECAFIGYGIINAKNCTFVKCGPIRYDSLRSKFNNCIGQQK